MNSIELIGQQDETIRGLQIQVSELIRCNAQILTAYKADTERLRKALALKPDTLRQTIADFGKPKTVTVHVHKMQAPSARECAVHIKRVREFLRYHRSDDRFYSREYGTTFKLTDIYKNVTGHTEQLRAAVDCLLRTGFLVRAPRQDGDTGGTFRFGFAKECR